MSLVKYMNIIKKMLSTSDNKKLTDRFSIPQKKIDELYNAMNPANISDPINVEVLGQLTMLEREEFALRTGTLALYLGDEVPLLQKSEEDSALCAMPKGYAIEQLNGVNIGCGGRTVSEYLTPIDIMRSQTGATGEHDAHTQRAILALPEALPFKEDSLDFIIALHMLEHVPNPDQIIKYFLSLLKPGGGVGIVIPDWRYTWDARHDVSEFGHKWNCTPSLVKNLYDTHWSKISTLEALDTYEYKMSFDFVLRKHGEFTPFDLSAAPKQKSGRQLYEEGSFLA